MVGNWKQKLGSLIVAIIIWYLIKGHLRTGGTIPRGFVDPGQVMVEHDESFLRS